MAIISGDFGTVDIPNFALESTLQALLAEQNETRDAMDRVGGNVSGVSSNISNVAAGVNVTNKTQAGIRSILQKTQRQAQAQNVGIQNRLMSGFRNLSKGFRTGTVQAMRTGDMTAILNNMGTFGAALQTTIGILKDYRDSIQNLTNVGQGFGKSILETQKVMGKLGMGLSEFERVVTRNGTAIAQLGTEEQNAAVAFAGLSRRVRDNMKDLGNYGFKITEINDFLAENLEIERRSGATGREATENTASAFNALAKETTLRAIETGRERKAMLRAALEARASENFQAAIRQEEMDGNQEVAENMRRTLDSVTVGLGAMIGPDLAGQLVDAMTTGVAEGRGLEATQAGQMFLAAGGPMADALNQITLNFKKITPEETVALLEKFQSGIDERVGELDDISRLANVHEGYALVRSAFLNQQKVNLRDTKVLTETFEARQKALEGETALLQSEEAVNNAMVSLQGALANVAVNLSKFAGGAFQSTLLGAMGAIEHIGNAFNNPNFTSVISDLIGPDGLQVSRILESDEYKKAGAESLEGSNMFAAAFGMRQFGKEGAKQALKMSTELGQKYSIQGNDVVDAQGNKLQSYKAGNRTVFKGSGGEEFFKKGDQLIPSKLSLGKKLVSMGGKASKIAGPGGIALIAALEAMDIEQGIGGNIDRLLTQQAETEKGSPEHKKLQDQITKARANYWRQYAKLMDEVLLTGGATALGALVGSPLGPVGSIATGIAAGYGGQSIAESGAGPMQWLADVLGVEEKDLKSQDRQGLMKRIENTSSQNNVEQEDTTSQLIQEIKEVKEVLISTFDDNLERTGMMRKGLGQQRLAV